MELNQPRTSRSFQKIVRVLRDLDDVHSVGQGMMRGIGFGLGHLLTSGGVPPHDQSGILIESLGRSQLHGIVATPPAVAGIAKRTDA